MLDKNRDKTVSDDEISVKLNLNNLFSKLEIEENNSVNR